ncbi:MAG: S-layer family protein [Symploca sp. SIO2G7]|nr:S-layer family protein [Symploca sp. SIO2G7]
MLGVKLKNKIGARSWWRSPQERLASPMEWKKQFSSLLPVAYCLLPCLSRVIGFLSIMPVVIVPSPTVRAQLVPDNTLGAESSLVTPIGLQELITGGATRGSNLFHSFVEFNIDEGEQVYFANPNGIENILTRVTGNNESNILGTLGVNGSAHLFLLNPKGIVFGEQAQLDMGGSFTASTTDAIKLGDKAFFSATDTANSSLLDVKPEVLFNHRLRTQTAPISNEGNLAVAPGQDLTLQGDEIQITGSITVLGGNLLLNSNGNISLTESTVTNTNIGLTGNGSIELQAENISLERSQIISRTISNQTAPNVTVNATGEISISGFSPLQPNQNPLTQILNSRISTETYGEGDGGEVIVNAAQLTFEDGGQIAAWVGPQATGNGGKVIVDITDSIIATGAYPFNPLLGSGILSYTLGAGRGGDLDISTSRINLADGAFVSSFVQGTGRGGDVNVKVAELVEVTGVNPLAPQFRSSISSVTVGKGDSGTLNLSTKQLRLFVRGYVGSSSFNQLAGNPVPGAGEGNAGDVTVNAQQIEVLGASSVDSSNLTGILNITTGSGNIGNLTVTTDSLSIRDGGVVLSSVFLSTSVLGQPLPNSGTGNGGNVTVNASESIEIIGSSPLFSSSTLGTATFGMGNAGDTFVNTPQLRLVDGGIISSSTAANGDAGKITINAADIFISGTTPDQFPAGIEGSAVVFNADIQQTFFIPPELTGNTGEVTINTNQLTIQNRGQVRVRHQGIGDAGSLTINSDSILLTQGGQINATTASGAGGDIALDVNKLLLLRQGSSITAEALGGTGDGGNLEINAQQVVAIPTENSDIVANAVGGNGGNINITSDGIFGLQVREQLTPLSDITASSQSGISGDINLNTLSSNPSQSLVELPSNLVDASEQITADCSARTSNRFVVTGRGGIPDNPTEYLRGHAVWQDTRNLSMVNQSVEPISNYQQPTTNNQTQLVEAQGWFVDKDGTVILTAEAFPEKLPRVC